MRLIDADTLVNKIVFHTDMPSDYKEQVEDTISDMPTIEPEPHWIPCSERLPEDKREKGNNVIEEAPSTEAKTKCIAQIKVDTEELVRRIKEEYNIADGLPEKDGYCYEIQREDLATKDDKRFFNALKPSKEIDRSWGIGMKVPVCPNCEAIISPMCFWKNCGDKVGWCEYCGQKIDWSEWK